MIEMQTKQTQQTRPKPSNGAQSNYAPTQPHLQALNHRLIDLLGDDYAIELDDPHNFVHEGKPFIRFENRCVYYSHNDKHFDKNPSGWVGVSPTDGQIISGCWVCRRPQIIKHQGEYQPAPTLLTLSCNDKRLLKVLVAFDCEEVKEVNGREQPAVAFPVIYADGSAGKHYRVALEGSNKWLHKEGGKAGEAVFALHRKGIQSGIQKKRMVVVIESPLDAAVLNAAGFPAIAVLGKGNAGALACDYHKETLFNLLGDDGVVYVWQEPDAKEFAQKVANALQRPVKVIYPPDYAKDAFRLWLACGKDWDRFKAEIDRLIENATEIAPQPEPASEFDSQDTIVRVTFPPQIRKKVTDIQPLEFEWLVKEYIPIGVVTLLAGAGGHGKTSLLCDLAASIVKGGKWLNKFEVPQGGVILIVTEDPAGIRDKLFSYGVNSEDDPLLIYDLTEWEEGSEEEYKPIKAAKALPAILQDAKEVLGNIPIRLVGLDCLRGFGFDEAQASRKKKSDRLPTVREIYKPLAKFAEKEGCAVIVTHHFRKLQTEDLKSLKPKRKKGKEVAPEIDKDLLVSLVAGTAETVNAARQALVVIGDKEAGVGIIVPVKSNRSVVLGAPIRYDFYAETPTFLEFLDEEETAIETAIAFLRRVLSKGEIPSNELEALAKKEGISHRTYWRARQRLGVKAKKVFVDGKQVWFSYLPNQTNQTDPQDSPTDQPAGDGSLPTNPDNTPNFGSLGSLGEKPKQNLGFPRLPTEEAFGSLGSVPASVEDCQDCQAQNHWQSALAVSESPINTGVFEQDCQDCQTFGNLETRPEGDLQGNPTDQSANETRPAGDPLTTFSPPDRPQGYPTPQGSPNQSEGDPLATVSPQPDRPETADSPTDKPEGDLQPTDPLWLIFDGVLPELVVGSPPVNEPAKEPDPQPTDRPEPEGDPTAQPANETQSAGDPQTTVSPQAAQPEPEIEFIQINSIAKTETEEIPPYQPVTEPIYPVCGERLDPEPDSGLAACLGCGRLFRVEIPPTNPDDDDKPPETPNNNGHGGGIGGFAPP
ncbi:MAG: AAA family ATPase, partial [Armatimonadota bacterium]